jgi:hypothetical protein
MSGSFGGPTIFLQAPPSPSGEAGLWGEFKLPEGKQAEIEEGPTSLSIYDCQFLGVLYREVSCPPRPPTDANGEMDPEARAAWKLAHEGWSAILQREDTRMTLCGGSPLPKFVTLVPIGPDYRID